MGPLEGCKVLEYSTGPATGFAGMLLKSLGADVDFWEPVGGSPLRDMPPRHEGSSMLFGYVAAGKRVRSIANFDRSHAMLANIVLHDDILPPDIAAALKEGTPVPAGGRVVVRCSPYGATGPKQAWQGAELSLFQAGGEGYLMPHGLPYEEHPDRPPIGAGRYLAHYQAGIAAALAAVAALRKSRSTGRTERIDCSIQEAQLSLNYFTVSRWVEGARESRKTRAFRYAGILKCSDGWMELVPLEEHHWTGVLKLLGTPAELDAPEFATHTSRAAHGDRINVLLRRWAAVLPVREAVAAAIEAGVPCGPYLEPKDLADEPQLKHRRYFVSHQAVDAKRADLFPGPAWTFDRWDRPRLQRAESRQGGEHASA